MTIIINKCWGGFHIPEALCESEGLVRYDDIDREDVRLVEFVQSHGGEYREGSCRLVAVEVPDTCTDWEMDEYDGFESIIYVVDGKLYHA
jgi:hypothetical protein